MPDIETIRASIIQEAGEQYARLKKQWEDHPSFEYVLANAKSIYAAQAAYEYITEHMTDEVAVLLYIDDNPFDLLVSNLDDKMENEEYMVAGIQIDDVTVDPLDLEDDHILAKYDDVAEFWTIAGMPEMYEDQQM